VARLQRSEALNPLGRALVRLSSRLEALEAQLDAGEDVWGEYAALAGALATVLGHASPGAHGELLTTRDMAARLGLKPKTLLRHVASGAIVPAVRRGRLIRWKGSEVPK
jgi:helix-turn-helix protein